MKILKVGNKNPSGRGQSGTVVSDRGIFPALGAGGGNPTRKRDIGWSSGYVLVSPKIKLDDLYICEKCARIHLWKNNAQNVREVSHLEISSMLHDIEMGNIPPANPVKK